VAHSQLSARAAATEVRVQRGGRRRALDSLVCPGSIVSGGLVEGSILGPLVRINSYAHVKDSILFEGVDVGRRARIQRAIIEKGVRIPPNTEIGFDLERDRSRGLTVSRGGVVVVPNVDGIESCW
jgi:glucose-1-phosphate adenylyltransferase